MEIRTEIESRLKRLKRKDIIRRIVENQVISLGP